MKAFPTQTVDMNRGGVNYDIDGMDLRDYFAAKAVSSIFDNSNLIFEDEDYKEAATIAYKFADAMIKAREL